MSKLASLIRAELRSNFGLSVLRYKIVKERKDLWRVLVFVLAAASLTPMFIGIVALIENLYRALQPTGQQGLVLTIGILVSQLTVLLFGLYYVISAFYFSRDLQMLIPLPLRPYQVIGSKFATILVNEYLTILPFLVPVVVVFGIMEKSGLAYWLTAIVIYLCLPIIPLAAASILVVVMMRLINLSRKKDALILVGGIVLITGALLLQLALQRAEGRHLTSAGMAALLASRDSLVSRAGAGFPPSIWATKALTRGLTSAGVRNLLLFAVTSAVFCAGMLVAAERLFYRGLVGLGEVSGRRRVLSAAEMSQHISTGRHPVRAILRREWWLMNRTPVFLLNGTLTVVLVPVLLVVMTTTGSGRGDASTAIEALTSANSFAAILATALFMTVSGSLNGTASSTFSREGKEFWISQVIPVAGRDQAAAKFLHSYIVSVLGIAVAATVCVFAFHLHTGVILPAAALALAATVPLIVAGMAIDLARPLLDWSNPQKAIKQNLNVLLGLVADVALLTALYYIVKGLRWVGVTGSGALAVLFAVLVALGIVAWGCLARFADRRYCELEI
jgi:ABC-2 type transport system permease protein